jgi:hypothetical protein
MDSPSPAGLNLDNLQELGHFDWSVTAYRSVEGGGTGIEFTDNLRIEHESPGNKWYDCCEGETWIEATFDKPRRIKFFQLKSANDCPERDPYSFSVQVRNNLDSEFITINKFNAIKFSDRFQCLDFKIDTVEPVTAFRITIHSNRSLAECDNWGSGTQLAQIRFYV